MFPFDDVIMRRIAYQHKKTVAPGDSFDWKYVYIKYFEGMYTQPVAYAEIRTFIIL